MGGFAYVFFSSSNIPSPLFTPVDTAIVLHAAYCNNIPDSTRFLRFYFNYVINRNIIVYKVLVTYLQLRTTFQKYSTNDWQ